MTRVLVHADGGACNNTPLVDGRCPGCGISPDMQSTAIIDLDLVDPGSAGPEIPSPTAASMFDNFSRHRRQRVVAEWCHRAFGAEHTGNVQQRALRLLEEVIEAYQATGADPAMAHRLVDFVFARPVGELPQELGGIGVTLLALANAAGVDADRCERLEVERVLAKPLKFYADRNAAKDAAGFVVTKATATPSRFAELESEVKVLNAELVAWRSGKAAQSIPMFLTCPSCSARHIDLGEFATKVHHTHSCQSCGLTWRPAVVATVGVQFLPGFKD